MGRREGGIAAPIGWEGQLGGLMVGWGEVGGSGYGRGGGEGRRGAQGLGRHVGAPGGGTLRYRSRDGWVGVLAGLGW